MSDEKLKKEPQTPRLQKVISGGQTGADRAGLIAAHSMGMKTGGFMPRGFRAEDGNHPEFADKFDIQEHRSAEYPPRTALNVQMSDGTIRFATNWRTRGEQLTLRKIHEFGIANDCRDEKKDWG